VTVEEQRQTDATRKADELMEMTQKQQARGAV
jgi:hypothetical protein